MSSFYPEVQTTFGPRFLAYVDILGWSDLVGSPRRAEVLERIDRAILHLRTARNMEAERREDFERASLRAGSSVRTAFFSDTFLFSCAPDVGEVAWVLDSVQPLCWLLLRRGLYTRGALVVGDLRHDDDGTVVGRALIEAHKIERDVAKYPRLIVTDEAAPLVAEARIGANDNNREPFRVRTDFDGLRYLDIVGSRNVDDVREARARVLGDLDESARAREADNPVEALNLRAKYHWLLGHFDEFLKEHAPV